MDKIYIEVKVKLIVRSEPGVNIDDVMNEMDYNFVSQTENADIEETEIMEYDVIDSK